MLSLTNITKHFGTALALDDVSFDVRGGEVHALLGENGAGKTTLMRIAYGMVAPDSGQITVRGGLQEIVGDRLASPRAARALGIGMVHQQFTSIAALTVAENVALAAGWQRMGRLPERAAAVIARLGLPLEPTAVVRDLSVQLRQRLEIVQALASDARILLLDEPTAVLAPREVGELLDLVRRFRDQGGAVVLISHKLAEVTQVADRVTVLRRGSVTLSGAARDHDAAALSRAMIGPELTSNLAVGPQRSLGVSGPASAGEVRVRLRDVVLRAGEIVGVAAIEGNGQRELLRTIGGLQHDAEGVVVHGDVTFVPEDRMQEALIGEWSLGANYLLGNIDRAPQWMDWTQLRRETAELVDRHDVRAGGVADRVDSLSGGNQQKFVLGRALERRTAVLVVEQPTRGLDLLAASAIHAALREAAQQGCCVIVHSTDLDEVLSLADRLLVVIRGKVRELPPATSREVVGDVMLGIA